RAVAALRTDSARHSSVETASTGTPDARASPHAVARPTRMPVNEPGPAQTARRSHAASRVPASASTRAIAGSSASDARRSEGSAASSSAPPETRLTAGRGLAVSMARICMVADTAGMLAPSVATSSPPSSRVTPMLRQYFEMKNRVPDAILLYRMGDFYEMFFDDAKDAAPLLGIALTARHKDSDIEAPMCGVPHQSVDHHVAKLVAAGRKVAICDQMEDAREAKGLVRRDITRVVTPGTVLDPESLVPNAPSYLAAVCPADAEWGLAF